MLSLLPGDKVHDNALDAPAVLLQQLLVHFCITKALNHKSKQIIIVRNADLMNN